MQTLRDTLSRARRIRRDRARFARNWAETPPSTTVTGALSTDLALGLIPLCALFAALIWGCP
jgi:hypothetical protein